VGHCLNQAQAVDALPCQPNQSPFGLQNMLALLAPKFSLSRLGPSRASSEDCGPWAT